MKILCYRNGYDHNFESMISILSKTKYTIGYVNGDLKSEVIDSFAPDIIMHNFENVTQLPVGKNHISININETESDNSFSLKNPEAKNFIEPFVVLKDKNVPADKINKFKSDVLYIGNPFMFDKDLVSFLTNSDFIFKFFDHNVFNFSGYCGICNNLDYFKFYNHSKASIIKSGDIRRILDTVAADGNPVIIDDNERLEDSIDKIKAAVENNKKYEVENYSKNDVIEKHTVFDRVSDIFSKIGLSQIAKEIKNLKSDWNKTK